MLSDMKQRAWIDLDEFEQEMVQERAAIMEFDGKVPRMMAYEAAMKELWQRDRQVACRVAEPLPAQFAEDLQPF